MSESPRGHPERNKETEIVDIGPIEKPFLIEWRKDTLREKIALPVTYGVIAVLILPIICVVAFPERVEALKDVVIPILTAATTLFGVVLGYYFAQKNS